MSRRVYIGNLPPNVEKPDLLDHFKDYQVEDLKLMGHFGFMEFGSSRDAEDAVRDLQGKTFMGESLIVEPSRESRRRDMYDSGGPPPFRGGGSAPKGRGVRIAVIGVPSSTSWQDLKDFGRMGGSGITYADIDHRNAGQGLVFSRFYIGANAKQSDAHRILEYPTIEEAEEAIRKLSGIDINGSPVTLEIGPAAGPEGYEYNRAPAGPPRDRFDDRRGGGYDRRGGGYDDRRGGGYDDRRGGGGRYDDRRGGGYDDRRGGGYDDRRGGGRDRSPPPRRDYDRDRSPPRRDYDRTRSPPARRRDDSPPPRRREESPGRRRDDAYPPRSGSVRE
ncbi:hypothetical protein P7C73_g4555, partial [Tremellales sp. Uapishka_1]